MEFVRRRLFKQGSKTGGIPALPPIAAGAILGLRLHKDPALQNTNPSTVTGPRGQKPGCVMVVALPVK